MTDPAGKEHVYVAVGDLVDHVELTDVRFYEIAGRRSDTEDKQFSLQVVSRIEPTEIEIRCQTAVEGGGAQYKVDAGAVFAIDPPGTVPPEVAHEFAEKVGVMSVYPYARSAVANLGAQLNVDRPTLPLLRADNVRLNTPDAAPESDSG
ncbi:hypothetical protein C8258_18350 [Nocardia sp. MDA0666]|uniref:hypothetical protein n=1 Tax=Nocardia sp. MDA0666 TaxID=2135448 RepID=UPI000D12BCFA|nr:hypothetical protein [Nocardia sp. MDA0666]PSR66843.1 hypothetical protein C8258_18350 [Nocardia sp. MDA0666]